MIPAELIERAGAGDRRALETLIEHIQDNVYGLALRMLWHPEDARDATQEILLRVVTHLSSFRGESAFLTWVYRVAANALINFRKSRVEMQSYDFERFGRELDEGLLHPAPNALPQPDDAVLVEEIKVGCTLGMLMCLDRAHRLAYILGEILEFDSGEAAEVLEISAVAFRQRLSRARNAVVQFMRQKCGLVNEANPCRCSRRVPFAIATGRIDPARLLFARHEGRLRHEVRKLEDARHIAAIYRSQPEFHSLDDFRNLVRGLVE